MIASKPTLPKTVGEINVSYVALGPVSLAQAGIFRGPKQRGSSVPEAQVQFHGWESLP